MKQGGTADKLFALGLQKKQTKGFFIEVKKMKLKNISDVRWQNLIYGIKCDRIKVV